MKIEYKENIIPNQKDILELYKSVNWGHTNCPNSTYQAIKCSSYVVTAWNDNILIGLGRAISDGYITAYFPDLLIKPEWQGKKIGTNIMNLLLKKYGAFHNQVLIAEDEKARAFYKKIGFKDETFALSVLKSFPNE